MITSASIPVRFDCVVPTLQGALGSSRDVIVNMSISTNIKHDYKLLTVIGPKRPAMQSLIRALETSLASMSHFWVSRFSDSVKRDFRFSFENGGISRDQIGSSSPISAAVAETTNQSYKTEEAAFYYFYKILMNRQYSIGNEVADFITEFTSNFPPAVNTRENDDFDQSSPTTSDRHSVVSSKRFSVSDCETLVSVPQYPPRESSAKVIKMIEQIISQFDGNYLTLRNPSSALVDDLLPRLRPSIERFMYESCGKFLVAHYKHAFYDDDKKFSFKSISIRGGSSSSTHLCESCGVRRDFQFGFEKSISQLNELQHAFSSYHTPNSILQRLLSILVSIKTEVLNGTKGMKELDSMDDIAPIFLFLVVSASDLRTPNAIYHYLLDTMPQDQRMETEGRAVALLEGATRIVLSEWATKDDASGSASPNSSLID